MSEEKVHAIVLRIPVSTDLSSEGRAWITDALGECARDLEASEAHNGGLGLIPDPDDEGRYAWSIVAESYPGIG